LREKRERAKSILGMLKKGRLRAFAFGSVARGDVREGSDIDICIMQAISPFQVELVLEKNGFLHVSKEIVMATPFDTVKLHFYLNELETITIPLSKLDDRTCQFFKFGGRIDLDQLNNGIRVPGIDKRLVFIQPVPGGYVERSIIGNEHVFAKQLDVSMDLINERKRVLLKREKLGRTGIFLRRTISPREGTEDVLKELVTRNAFVRKKLLK
jgi:hypothetical protein